MWSSPWLLDSKLSCASLRDGGRAFQFVPGERLAVHSTLQGLQRSQAASGLGMRRDWLETANLMDSFLRGSSDALNAGDLAAAQDLMTKDEIQADKLDKALR